jgi:DtxR family Mn-dependent transcriptional regulator
MVRRLADQGLLAYERYHGVKLTETGRRAALRTLRRHRVIEAYLAQALDYPWDRVHAEAERLEHAASDELVDRMAATMGEPEVDPHGAPIPTRDGSVDETEYTSLADLAVDVPGVVVRVADEDPAMLRYLAELSVVPGKRVMVKSRAPYGGPITLAVGRQEISVGPALAAHVLTAPLTAKAAGGKRG